jgi:hypothetical protein
MGKKVRVSRAILILVGGLFLTAGVAGHLRPQVEGGQAPSQDADVQSGGLKRGGMTPEEKTVRDAYARLMRYNTAHRDEEAADRGISNKPEDYIVFGINKIQTGQIQEIFNKQLLELITPLSGEVVSLKPNHLTYENGPMHASYEAKWETSQEGTEKSDQTTVLMMLQAGGEKYKDVEKYTSYEVTVSMAGKQRTYLALALHSAPSAVDQKPPTEVIDNITNSINLVLADQLPRIQSPWKKYVRSSLYKAIVSSIIDKERAGLPLIPADAPIGYLPGDEVDIDGDYQRMLALTTASTCQLTFSSPSLNSYLPTNGNSISFTATITPSTATGIIRFELYDISAYIGVAMNSGTQTTPDYDVSGSQTGFGSVVTEGSGASLVYKISTSAAVNSATININSRDFGGRAKIRVYAVVGDGEIAGTYTGTSSTFARMPKDDNNNNMPDIGWTAESAGINESITAPASDDDKNPLGNGTNGDGFTDFEEYRGVMVRGNHRRLNPFGKDLFIDSNVVVNIGYANNLPLTKHWVLASELNSDRYANFNYTNSGFGGNIAAHINQRGLRVRQVSGFPCGLSCYGETTTTSVPANPNTTTGMAVYVDAIRYDSPPTTGSIAPGDMNDNSAISKTTGHEVGHGIGMIGDYEYTGTRLTVMVSGFAWADATWSNIPIGYDAIDAAQIRLH